MPHVDDNPLRYEQPRSLTQVELATMTPEQITAWRSGSLPIVDETQKKAVSPQVDTMAIMHVLEQIRTEVRTLASEVAALESEVINLRRMQPPRFHPITGRPI